MALAEGREAALGRGRRARADPDGGFGFRDDSREPATAVSWAELGDHKWLGHAVRILLGRRPRNGMGVMGDNPPKCEPWCVI